MYSAIDRAAPGHAQAVGTQNVFGMVSGPGPLALPGGERAAQIGERRWQAGQQQELRVAEDLRQQPAIDPAVVPCLAVRKPHEAQRQYERRQFQAREDNGRRASGLRRKCREAHRRHTEDRDDDLDAALEIGIGVGDGVRPVVTQVKCDDRGGGFAVERQLPKKGSALTRGKRVGQQPLNPFLDPTIETGTAARPCRSSGRRLIRSAIFEIASPACVAIYALAAIGLESERRAPDRGFARCRHRPGRRRQHRRDKFGQARGGIG